MLADKTANFSTPVGVANLLTVGMRVTWATPKIGFPKTILIMLPSCDKNIELIYCWASIPRLMAAQALLRIPSKKSLLN
jgi:hypothetical protein